MKLMARVSLVALATLVAPAALGAQAVTAGASLERYSFAAPTVTGVSEIEVRTVPAHVALRVAWILLEASGGHGQATFTDGLGGRTELVGLMHSEVGASLLLPGERLLVRVSRGLASEAKEQSLRESVLAGLMANELLPFALPYWGDGGSLGADVGLGTRLGRARLRLVGGYRSSEGPTVLVDEGIRYQPGDRVRVGGTVDLPAGRGVLAFQGAAHRYSAPPGAEENLYHLGRRVEGSTSYAFPMGVHGGAMLAAGVIDRASGHAASDAPPGLPLAEQPAYRVRWTRLDLRMRAGAATIFAGSEVRSRTSPGGSCTAHLSGPPVCPGTRGHVATFSLSAELPLLGSRAAYRVALVPWMSARRGAVGPAGGTVGQIPSREDVPPGETSPVRGWGAGVTLRVGDLR